MDGIFFNSLLVTFSKSIPVIFLSWLFSSNLAKRNTWSTHLEEYSKKGSGNGPMGQNYNRAIDHKYHLKCCRLAIHRYRRARSNYNHQYIILRQKSYLVRRDKKPSDCELGGALDKVLQPIPVTKSLKLSNCQNWPVFSAVK